MKLTVTGMSEKRAMRDIALMRFNTMDAGDPTGWRREALMAIVYAVDCRLGDIELNEMDLAALSGSGQP